MSCRLGVVLFEIRFHLHPHLHPHPKTTLPSSTIWVVNDTSREETRRYGSSYVEMPPERSESELEKREIDEIPL